MIRPQRLVWTATLGIAAVCMFSSCDKARQMAADFAEKAGKGGTTGAESGTFVKELGEGEFATFRLQKDKVVIVDFHAPWCGPCRQLAPLLDEIAAEHAGKVVVGKINVDENRELAASEGVREIPDIRIYRNGEMVGKLLGLPPAGELRQRIGTEVAALGASPGAGDPPAAEPAIQPMTKDWLPPGVERR